MTPIIEDSIYINSHLIGVFIAGTVVGSVTVLGFIYYFYVKSEKIYFLSSACFLGLFLRIFASAFLILNEEMGELVHYNIPLLRFLMLLGSLIFIYVFVIFCAEILEDRARFHEGFGILLIVFVLFFLRDQLEDDRILWLFGMIYSGSYLITIIMDAFINSRYKKQPEIVTMVAGVQAAVILMTSYNMKRQFLIYNEWMIAIVMSFIMIGYFLWEYKVVYSERTSMYRKLVFDRETQCFSSNYIIEKLSQMSTGAVVYMDINHFRYVNDVYGHLTGDALIKSFALKISRQLTSGMVLGRFGGDEFIILMEDTTQEAAEKFSRDAIEAFHSTLNMLAIINGNGCLGLSIGIAFFDEGNRGAISSADRAMYRSKVRGNNQITFSEGQ